MKQLLTFLFVIAAVHFSVAQTDTLSAKGVYNGKNLFIQQPNTNNPCTLYIIANNKKLDEKYLRISSYNNGKGIEVRFDSLKLKTGDLLEAKIIFNKECRPKVLNPEVLLPQKGCDSIAIMMQGDSLIWQTFGEQGSLSFTVQQYKWNKWVSVYEIKGKGTPGKNRYACKVLLHSGENMFRVQQRTYNRPPQSKQLVVRSETPAVTFKPAVVTGIITFSAVTQYELYNEMGTLLKKGVSDKIDCSDLKLGMYYLNYDNQMGQFQKR